MPKDEIDWDDPEAVAKARGDNPDGEDESEEGKAAEAAEAEVQKEADEETADKDGDDKTTAKKGEEDKDEKNKGDKDDKEPMVPKSRLDSKTRQNKELADKLARYEKQESDAKRTKAAEDERTAIESELTDLDAAINKAIADDDMDEATRLRGVVRQKERALWQLDMDESAAVTTDEAREQVRLDLTIDHIEQTYNQFNPDSDDYSQETVDKVQELRAGFYATGNYTPTQALLRAMDYALPKKDMRDVADAANEAGKKADKEAERTKAGLKKATDAANKQPPDANSVGDDSDKHGLQEEINVDKLSYEDIANLPEATLKRLRGDNAA